LVICFSSSSSHIFQEAPHIIFSLIGLRGVLSNALKNLVIFQDGSLSFSKICTVSTSLVAQCTSHAITFQIAPKYQYCSTNEVQVSLSSLATLAYNHSFIFCKAAYSLFNCVTHFHSHNTLVSKSSY